MIVDCRRERTTECNHSLQWHLPLTLGTIKCYLKREPVTRGNNIYIIKMVLSHLQTIAFQPDPFQQREN